MNNRLEKAHKALDKETICELETLSPEELRNRITLANDVMQDVEEALESNPNYKKAKEDLMHLSSSKRDVFKRQKAIIRVALSLINRG